MGRNDEAEKNERAAAVARLPERLLRPLNKDDPQRPVLQQDLEARLAHELAGKGDDPPEQALAWLERRRPGRSGLWRWLAGAVVLLLSCIALELYQEEPLLALSKNGWSAELREEAFRRIYTVPPEKASYNIRLDQQNPVAGAERGWRAHPDDPAFYALYVELSLTHQHKLPEGYDETWRRIAPDNSLWLLYQAESQLNPAMTAAEKEAAMAQIRTAASMPRRQLYRLELQRKIIAEIRQPHTVAASILLRNSQLGLSYAPGFQPAISLLTEQTQALSASEEDRDAAEKILERYAAEASQLRKFREASWPPVAWRWQRMSLMIMLSRWTLLGLATFFLLGAGLLRLRELPAAGAPGRLARCVAALWRPGDAWKIALLGLAAPLGLGAMLCYGADARGYVLGQLVLGLPLPLLLALLAGMVTTADFLLSRRAAFLGMRISRRRIAANALMTGMAYVAVVIPGLMLAAEKFGMILPSLQPRLPLLTAQEICGGAAGLVLLWLLVKVMLGYASPEANLRHRVIARGLAPACVAMAVLLGVIALALHPLERMTIRPIPLLSKDLR
ncbi:MAG: hypothetical protein JWO82_3288 [Akkermansiaceae bacterium]|nr:hypothetical protein [Akkermansiaceae bacterium]